MNLSSTVNGLPTGNDVARLTLKTRVPSRVIVDPFKIDVGIVNLDGRAVRYGVEVPYTVTRENFGVGAPPGVNHETGDRNRHSGPEYSVK